MEKGNGHRTIKKVEFPRFGFDGIWEKVKSKTASGFLDFWLG